VPRSLALLASCLALLGCVEPDFQGDEGRIVFRSNLNQEYDPWRSAMPVAVGATIDFYAVDRRPNDAGVKRPPGSSPSLDGGALELLVAGVGYARVRAVSEGATRVDWTGELGDHFTVRAVQPASALLHDKYLALLPRQDLAPVRITTDAGPWADVGGSFLLAVGGELYLEAEVLDADGGRLAQAPGQVVVRSSGPIHADPRDFGSVISSDGGPGARSDLTLEVNDAGLGALAVRTVSVAEVTDIELRHAELGPGMVAIKATAKVDGGATLWQANVRWAFDTHFTEAGPLGSNTQPARKDLLVLTWNPGDAGTILAPVYAGVGSREVMIEIPIAIDGTPALGGAVLPIAVPRQRACGCASAGGGFSVVLLLALRRRRRSSFY
jgi:hypothetical protein